VGTEVVVATSVVAGATEAVRARVVGMSSRTVGNGGVRGEAVRAEAIGAEAVGAKAVRAITVGNGAV
jgi:hypothetical protein